jgi:hypothetical protein
VENASRMRNRLMVMKLTQSVNDHSLLLCLRNRVAAAWNRSALLSLDRIACTRCEKIDSIPVGITKEHRPIAPQLVRRFHDKAANNCDTKVVFHMASRRIESPDVTCRHSPMDSGRRRPIQSLRASRILAVSVYWTKRTISSARTVQSPTRDVS